MPPTDVEETATLPLGGFDSVGQGRTVQQKVEIIVLSLKQI